MLSLSFWFRPTSPNPILLNSPENVTYLKKSKGTPDTALIFYLNFKDICVIITRRITIKLRTQKPWVPIDNQKGSTNDSRFDRVKILDGQKPHRKVERCRRNL